MIWIGPVLVVILALLLVRPWRARAARLRASWPQAGAPGTAQEDARRAWGSLRLALRRGAETIEALQAARDLVMPPDAAGSAAEPDVTPDTTGDLVALLFTPDASPEEGRAAMARHIASHALTDLPDALVAAQSALATPPDEAGVTGGSTAGGQIAAARFTASRETLVTTLRDWVSQAWSSLIDSVEPALAHGRSITELGTTFRRLAEHPEGALPRITRATLQARADTGDPDWLALRLHLAVAFPPDDLPLAALEHPDLDVVVAAALALQDRLDGGDADLDREIRDKLQDAAQRFDPVPEEVTRLLRRQHARGS